MQGPVNGAWAIGFAIGRHGFIAATSSDSKGTVCAGAAFIRRTTALRQKVRRKIVVAVHEGRFSAEDLAVRERSIVVKTKASSCRSTMSSGLSQALPLC